MRFLSSRLRWFFSSDITLLVVSGLIIVLIGVTTAFLLVSFVDEFRSIFQEVTPVYSQAGFDLEAARRLEAAFPDLFK